MAHTYLGIDIGSAAIRLALVKDGAVERLAALDIPAAQQQAKEILPDALAKELRALLKRERITQRHCALVLPLQTAFVRSITLPWMTEKQLQLNLPYEFQDYIKGNQDNYFFDYAFVRQINDQEGKPVQMQFLAAVAARETIAQCRTALAKAGLKLAVAVPEYLTYRNLIRFYEKDNPQSQPAEYCIIDLGDSATRVHMYRSSVYETTQVIELGGRQLAEVPRKADGGPEEEPLRELCSTIAIESLRSINFYGFNTPDSDLQDVYLTAGVTANPVLAEIIRNNIPLHIHTLDDLMPAIGRERRYGTAVGAALELMGR